MIRKQSLASFDVFDTILYRKCGQAENVFALLALRLFPNDKHKREMFFLWRNSIPHRMKREEKDYRTLFEIYQDKDIPFFPEYTPLQILQLELEIEYNILAPYSKVVELIEDARKKGCTIAFISDMYLSSDFIVDILRSHGIFRDGDYIFVSCEKMARKDDGELFDVIRSELKPTSWTHYGDNVHSDIVMAEKKGINAIHVDIPYSDVERNLISMSHTHSDPRAVASLAGFCRSLRLEFGNDNKSFLGADFVAPCYVGYVIHLINDAHRRGIKKLFFLSRDGYILQKIAEIIPHDGIELKYLFVSRKSLMAPYIYINNKEDILSIFPNNTIIGQKVSVLVQNMGLLDSEINMTDAIENILTREDENTVLDLFICESSKSNSCFKKKYGLCNDYFLQEGVYEDNIALVDVGWIGTTRIMINSMRKHNYKKDLFCYYFGVDDDVFSSRYGDFDCYIKGIQQNAWNCFVVEDYFSACNYPSTIGYTRINGKIEPVFKNGSKINDNQIAKINIPIVKKMAEYVRHFYLMEDSLYLAAANSYAFLTNTNNYIDFSFFAENVDNDEFTIRKLTWRELWQLVRAPSLCLTTNNKVSVQITLGKKWSELFFVFQHYYIKTRKIYWSIIHRNID